MRCVQCITMLLLSYQKLFLDIFSNLSILRVLGGPKVTQHRKKVDNYLEGKNLNQEAKWNKKMGGRRFGHHMWCFHGHSSVQPGVDGPRLLSASIA